MSSWNRIVDLHVLLDRRNLNPLIESRVSLQPLDGLEFIQADKFLLRLWFYNRPSTQLGSPIPVRLSADTYLVFAGKLTTNLAAETTLFKAENFTEVADEDLEGVYYYEAVLDLNTTALNSALNGLGATTRTLQVAIDIENQSGDNSERLTKQFDALVRRQVYAGEPAPEGDDEPYPPAGNVATKTMVERLQPEARSLALTTTSVIELEPIARQTTFLHIAVDGGAGATKLALTDDGAVAGDEIEGTVDLYHTPGTDTFALLDVDGTTVLETFACVPGASQLGHFRAYFDGANWKILTASQRNA